MSWHPAKFIEKAQHFSQLSHEQSDVQLSSLLNAIVVEFLVRACVASISPYLLACSKSRAKGAVFVHSGSGDPPSMSAGEVLDHCVKLYPQDFDENIKQLCLRLFNARNSDLHSASCPWVKPGNQLLHATSYVVIFACIKILNVTPEEFFDEHIEVARDYVENYNSELQRRWEKHLRDATAALAKLTPEEVMQRVAAMASVQERPEAAIRPCPACTNKGVLGFKVRMFPPKFDASSGLLVLQGHRLPIAFQCPVCELKVMGNSLLRQGNMGEVEPYESDVPAIDLLTREQALEQIGERFGLRDLLSQDDHDALMDGIGMRDHYDNWRDDD